MANPSSSASTATVIHSQSHIHPQSIIIHPLQSYICPDPSVHIYRAPIVSEWRQYWNSLYNPLCDTIFKPFLQGLAFGFGGIAVRIIVGLIAGKESLSSIVSIGGQTTANPSISAPAGPATASATTQPVNIHGKPIGLGSQSNSNSNSNTIQRAGYRQ